MIAVNDRSALARWAEPGLAERLAGPVAFSGDWSTSLADVRDEDALRAARLEATPERWREALRETAAVGGIVQRYAPQYATPMAIGGRLVEGAGYTDMEAREADRRAHATDFAPANNMEGLYLFCGRFSGVYTRCGYQPTIGEWTNRFHMGCLVVDE